VATAIIAVPKFSTRFKEFFDGAASWSRVERIIARVEVGAEGPDTRSHGEVRVKWSGSSVHQ